MAHISTFLQVSIDGYFAGPAGEIDWFKNSPDPEFQAFSLERASGDSTLLFGRTTYEMMASAWPSDQAHEDQPGMAGVMAASPKIVFSKSMQSVEEGPRWRNVELRREIDLFCELFTRPAVMAALKKFVEDSSLMPYLP